MKLILIYIMLILPGWAFSQVNLDSLDKANSAAVKYSYGHRNIPRISYSDSSITLYSDIRSDHRFFGYEKPDVSSKRLILFSIFTNDVENNPFNCRYGAFYETSGMNPKQLRYVSRSKNFIKTRFIDPQQPSAQIYIFFEAKWFRWEK